MKTLLIVLLLAFAGVEEQVHLLGATAHSQRIPVDIQQSVIEWKGTKMRGLGKHEGTVKLQSGFLVMEEGALTGGTFIINMRSIQVTDIPLTDPVPRRKLRSHLLDEDFFAVASYPTASLTITRVHQQKQSEFAVTGNLTIKGITRPVAFKAILELGTSRRLSARASITLNRQLWNVSFKGSPLQNNLVDDLIQLNVLLLADRVTANVTKHSQRGNSR